MTAPTDPWQQRRELRLRIGRLRRRIDRRVRSVQQEGRRLLSWRTYVRRYPGQAVLAAFALGLAASEGVRGGWSRVLGRRLLWAAVHRGLRRVGQDLEQVWADSEPGRPTPETPGAEHG